MMSHTLPLQGDCSSRCENLLFGIRCEQEACAVQGPPHILDMRGKGSGLSMAVWYKGTFSICNFIWCHYDVRKGGVEYILAIEIPSAQVVKDPTFDGLGRNRHMP